MGDIVTTVQKYTKPLQPFIDTFEAPVPIVSAFDSSETIGDLLLQGAGLSPDQQDRFDLMIKVIKAVNTFDLSGSTGGAAINFGDINLTGLSVTAGGELGDSFGFDTSQLQNAIQQIIDSPSLQDLQDTLEDVATYAGVNAQAGFQFPVLEDPGPVIGGILTGQTRDMFTFTTGREHFELAPSIGFGIPDVFGVFLTAGITLDADFSVGYDTAGLIKFAQDPLYQPEDLLHGFYFDNSIDDSGPPIPNVASPRKAAFYLQGFAAVSASAVATVSGGIHANVAIELVNQDNSPHVYLDTMLQNINGPTSVFNASGQLYASASIELTIPNPIGPNITLFSYELARQTLLDYDPLPPASETKPLVVIDVTNEHTLQLKTAQMSTVGQVTVQPFHNMSVLIAGQTVVADGIRVDYAGEIDLYIERKNDFTTNYYNLVGLDGPAPDGVSIHIVDPFRVFADEGATDPEPAQTTPGVILVGGRNVTYDYSEAGDGTHATVFLAGGYGSSTLAGGTMEFGNFIPTERIDQAKQHFGDVSGFDSAGQTMINSQIDAAVAPADPTGIIGSTMTASHGGLMFGGPGNNSFFAAGPGAYEMIGGTWVNTFNISPSFGGVPATYQIDGGPFGQSQLIVRVPAGENVTFENSTTVDKYNPAYKALAVQANAGLSATAHGINKVQIIGTPGASVTLGDTSELNIEFAVRGGIELTFGGTNEPDIFSVATTGPYHGLANHFSAPFIGIGGPIDYETFTAPPVGPRLADPVYSVTRTFGTNGRTQTIPFAVSDTTTSSIKLNGGGASDTYSINLGVGAFIDVAVNDTDTSSTNALTVATGDGSLLYNSLNFTDTTVELDYYTGSFYYGGGLGYSYFTTSVHYAPTVTFSGNVVPSIQAAIPFQHTTIDRPLASQAAQLSIGGPYTSTVVPVAGLVDIANSGVAWVVTTNPPTRIVRNLFATPPDVQILANAGSLSISSTTQYQFSIDVLGNSGTLSITKSGAYTGAADGINVLGNTGVVNLDYTTSGTASAAQINFGRALQSVANVHGTVNLAGLYDLTIDDRGHSGTPPSWLITTTHTRIGDLTINYDYSNSYQALWKTGSAVTYRDNIAFSFASYNLNDFTTVPYFPFYWSPQSTLVQNSDGESITLGLSDYFVGQPPAGTTTYDAANLPPGLSVNPTTGVISGTIPYGGYAGSPYSTVISATNGLYTRQWTLEWDVYNAIGIYIPYFDPLFPQPVNVDEAVFVSLDPISIYDSLNRTPVVTVTGLPAGLSFNPDTGAISGTIPAGAASTHGPYDVHVHADDGIETNDIAFPMIVSGIQLTLTPIVRLNHNGDVVDFNLNATTTSGGRLTYSATGLPAGITLNTATGQITGTLSANANTQSPYSVEVSYDDGYSTKTNYITWTVLQTGVMDQISFLPIGSQSNKVGDGASIHAQAATNLMLPVQLSVQGLPPGLAFSYTPYYFNGYVSAYIYGTIPAAAALNSPYHVTITATNGLDSASVSFDWQITGPQPPALPGDFDGSGVVDQADYGIWRGSFGQSVTPYTMGDGNGDGKVDAADYVVWRKHLGQSLGGGAATAVATQESISVCGTSCSGIDVDLLVSYSLEVADRFHNGPRIARRYFRRIWIHLPTTSGSSKSKALSPFAA